jgi:hypothetical protein
MLNETTIGHPGNASGRDFARVRGEGMNRIASCVSIFLIFLAALILATRATSGVASSRGGVPGTGAPGVSLTFPDFPAGVVVIDLGQSLDVDVTTTNDGGKGVTWTCTGDACAKPAKMASTPTTATFRALGITGTATITAKSIEQPAIARSVTVTVGLNDVPDALCTGDMPPPGFE